MNYPIVFSDWVVHFEKKLNYQNLQKDILRKGGSIILQLRPKLVELPGLQ